MKYAAECSAQDAPRFKDWIANRGGVAIWTSINLSNPGASWSTPALDPEGKPTPKPTWQAGNTPTIVTDAAQIGVYTEELFTAFRVGLRPSGMSVTLTNGAQRKVNAAMAKCHEKHGSAHLRKGVLPIDGASIGVYYTASIIPLTEFKEAS